MYDNCRARRLLHAGVFGWSYVASDIFQGLEPVCVTRYARVPEYATILQCEKMAGCTVQSGLGTTHISRAETMALSSWATSSLQILLNTGHRLAMPARATPWLHSSSRYYYQDIPERIRLIRQPRIWAALGSVLQTPRHFPCARGHPLD
jgi:hypothetical protein